ncbi:hypothetical protein B0H13DRAFT_2316665 [Mycena leptocephala]|nr:hypothetical protein B0H13DRAFT_2316665 [Mycena leptocephala]
MDKELSVEDLADALKLSNNGKAPSQFVSFHASPTVPASNTAAYPELATVLPRCAPECVLFCITDIQAGGSAPMHHGGEEKTVKAGEFIVQRGANHAWQNRTQDCSPTEMSLQPYFDTTPRVRPN